MMIVNKYLSCLSDDEQERFIVIPNTKTIVDTNNSKNDENIDSTENAISAIGKICKSYSNEMNNSQNIISDWIQMLALINDDDNNIDDIKSLRSDWLCSKCYFYNIYKDDDDDDDKKNKNKKDNKSLNLNKNKCERIDCKSLMSLDCVRINSLTGNPYICGEIIVDKVKGNIINLKSNAVLVIEGIDIITTEDIIKSSFKEITTIQSFLQFTTSNKAKTALKQA